MTESWRTTWREGVAPLLSTAGLLALQTALVQDDPRLIQGAMIRPTHLHGLLSCPVEAACAVAFCGWQGDDLKTVGEVEEFFARMCSAIDHRLGDPDACPFFFNWFDVVPRAEMRSQLLEEVTLVLTERLAEKEWSS